MNLRRISLLAVVFALLLDVSSGTIAGLRRALQQIDYCDPLDYTIPALPNCSSCPACTPLYSTGLHVPPLPNCSSCPACTAYSGCAADCNICADGSYLETSVDPDACVPCLSDCKKCTNATFCSRCGAGKFFFATPTPACLGSLTTCGATPPDTFNPTITGGLSLSETGTGSRLVINANFSNYFYNVKMHYRTCTLTEQTGPTPTAGPLQYCNSVYSASTKYVDDCNFDLTELETVYIYSGVLDIEVNYDLYFMGNILAYPGVVRRPIGWTLTLSKLLTSEVNIQFVNDDQCEQYYPVVYGQPTASVACNRQGCQIFNTSLVTGTPYLQCVCDACHTGPYCETDTCAPTPICPTGTLTINLNASLGREHTKLGLLPPNLAFVPSAIDNNASGWSTRPAQNIYITRRIGSVQTVVQTLAGVNTDNLLTMVWNEATYDLDTPYTVTYVFNDLLGGPLGTCTFYVQIKDVGIPTIACPANILTNTMPSWSLNVSTTDNIDQDVTVTQTAGELPGYVTENTRQAITLRGTDASGNYAECSFSVTYDTTPPLVVCPADPAVNANVDSVSGTYTQQSWTAIQAAISFSDPLSGLVGNLPAYGSWSGDADGTTYTQQATNAGFYVYQPGGGANVGHGGRTYTHWDLAGNSAQCILRVKVTDVTPPTVTCPPQQNKVAAPASNAVAITGWAALFASQDNVGVTSSTSIPATASFTITSGVRGGQPWNVTYTATDAAGLSTTCYTLVFVQDTQNPSVTCPANIVVPMDTGDTSYTVPATKPWGNANSADNDGVASVVHNATATLVSGANTITYTVTDHTGLTAACSFTVTVKDMERPTFNPCPSTPPALIRYTQAGVNYWTANFRSAGVIAFQDNNQINLATLASNYLDNVNMVWTTGSDPITVNYYVEDASKNNATCRFTVNIVDNQAPVIFCSNQIITTDNGKAFGSGPVFSFAVSDNADSSLVAANVVYFPSAGFEFNLGSSLVQASLTDEDGNTGHCNFTLTVQQKCGDLYTAGGEQCEHQSARNPAIGIGCTLTCTCNTTANYFPKSYVSRDCLYRALKNDGDHTMVGAVVAGGGSVIIQPGSRIGTQAVFVDVTPSTSSYPLSTDFKLVKAAISVSFNTALGNLETTDAFAGRYLLVKVCPTVNDVSLRALLYQGSKAGVDTDTHCAGLGSGVPVRKYDTATGCWEFALCGSGLMVLGMTSSSALDWLQCNDLSLITVTTTAGYTANVAFNKEARATILADGNNSGALLKVSTSYGCPSGPTSNVNSAVALPPGLHTLTITANNGTTTGGACTFSVNVTDGVAPTLSGCPAQPLTIPLDAGKLFATYSLPSVSGVDETTFIGSGYTSGPYLCESPDQTVGLTPTANFAGAPGGTYSGGPTATLRVGTTQFTWSVKDGAGNGPTTCVYSVTVVDTEPPVLTCPPITIAAQAGMPTGTLATTPVTVTDNLDGTSTKNAPVGTYAVGQHSIVYSTTDAAGNQASCTFTLTVNDLQPPTLTCPSSVSKNSAGTTATATWSVSYADNDLANTVLYQSIANASYFEVPSVTNVTITVKDKGSYPYAEGDRNSAQCVISVTIKDIGAPVLACPANVQVSTAAATAIATWAVATITDNDVSPAPTITGSTYASGASFPVKLLGASDPSVSTVTYSGRDASGNVGTCAFTVTVLDSGAPYFSGAAIGGVTPSCPSNIVLYSADYPGTGASGSPLWTDPVAVDHKGVANTAYVSQLDPSTPIEDFDLGSNSVNYMAEDAAGNQAFCAFTVTLVDNQIPVIACPADMSVFPTGPSYTTGKLNFTLQAYDDYTSWGNLSWSSSTGHPLPNPSTKNVMATDLALGHNLLKYVATDDAGNTAMECAFIVTVVDNVAPTITCPTRVHNNIGDKVSDLAYTLYKRMPSAIDPTTTMSWPEATTNDNSGAASVLTSYSPPQNAIFWPGTHRVTATATDLAGNQASCFFDAVVWSPYGLFSGSDAKAAVSRMIITDTATPGVFVADVQYVTQVKWPYLLKQPTANIPSVVHDFHEDLSKRSCPRLVDGAGNARGVWENVNTFCYQYWTMMVDIAACDQISVQLDLEHNADCWPKDCPYGMVSTMLDLKISAGNLCENDLGTVQAEAALFVMDEINYAAWDLTDKNADPSSVSSAFDDSSRVHAVVRAKSDQVLFKNVSMYAVTRRTYSDVALTGEPTANVALMTDQVINPDSGFEIDPKPIAGSNYAVFKYKEKSISLQSSEFVKLTVTVIVEYQLGTTVRRRLTDFDLDIPARRDLQNIAGGQSGLDASAGLIVRALTASQPGKTTLRMSGGFWGSMKGVIVICAIGVFIAIFLSCFIAYMGYLKGFKSGQKEGKASMAGFVRDKRASMATYVRNKRASLMPRMYSGRSGRSVRSGSVSWRGRKNTGSIRSKSGDGSPRSSRSESRTDNGEGVAGVGASPAAKHAHLTVPLDMGVSGRAHTPQRAGRDQDSPKIVRSESPPDAAEGEIVHFPSTGSPTKDEFSSPRKLSGSVSATNGTASPRKYVSSLSSSPGGIFRFSATLESLTHLGLKTNPLSPRRTRPQENSQNSQNSPQSVPDIKSSIVKKEPCDFSPGTTPTIVARRIGNQGDKPPTPTEFLSPNVTRRMLPNSSTPQSVQTRGITPKGPSENFWLSLGKARERKETFSIRESDEDSNVGLSVVPPRDSSPKDPTELSGSQDSVNSAYSSPIDGSPMSTPFLIPRVRPLGSLGNHINSDSPNLSDKGLAGPFASNLIDTAGSSTPEGLSARLHSQYSERQSLHSQNSERQSPTGSKPQGTVSAPRSPAQVFSPIALLSRSLSLSTTGGGGSPVAAALSPPPLTSPSLSAAAGGSPVAAAFSPRSIAPLNPLSISATADSSPVAAALSPRSVAPLPQPIVTNQATTPSPRALASPRSLTKRTASALGEDDDGMDVA
eukprot:g70290.t1